MTSKRIFISVFAITSLAFSFMIAGTFSVPIASAWGGGGSEGGGDSGSYGGDGCGGCGSTGGSTGSTVTSPVVPSPSCSLNANPISIISGNTSTLSWTSQNAVSATLNQSIGAVAVNGSRVVSPTQTVTYALTVRNSAGISFTCFRTITVTTPPPPAAPACTITATPSSIVSGGVSQLAWTTQNAVSASLNHSIGNVALIGNRTVTPTATRTYTMTVTNSAGVTATCATTVTVTDVPVFSCENNVSFTASPTSIRRGNATTLSWNVNGADSVRFTQGINATAMTGSALVSPSITTTYSLIARKGTTEISCPVTVTVTTGGSGGGYVIPSCELSASKRSISIGESVRLTWNSRDASDIEIKDNFSVVHITTTNKTVTEKRNLLQGSLDVTPSRTTTYTLTVENNEGRKRTCDVVVTVDSFVITQVRDQQPVASIILAEVPYTGFEAGPILTLIFYIMLGLWALYLTFIFVIRPKLHARTVTIPEKEEHHIATAVDNFPHMFVQEFTPPRFSPAVTVPVPSVTLPTSTPAVPSVTESISSLAEIRAIEERLHTAHILMSGVAMDYFMHATADKDRMATVEEMIENAKASFPSEGGWVVLNEQRMKLLFTK
jgi:hypothetical protein